MAKTTIYPARSIRTLWASLPTANAVAVRSGKILGVGTVETLQQWSTDADPAVIDNRFVDKTIVPGFIEAHAHTMDGAMWNFPYVGFFERSDPDGTLWEGCTSIEQVQDRLIQARVRMDSDPDVAADEPLVAWGLDPIYFHGERLNRRHLDEVSTDRQIFVFHASAHLATVNSRLLNDEGIDSDHPAEGIPKDDVGLPIGELQEPAAMAIAGTAWRTLISTMSRPETITQFASGVANAGITTVADLGTVPPRLWPEWDERTSWPDFPCRVLLAPRGYGGDDAKTARLVAERSTGSQSTGSGQTLRSADGARTTGDDQSSAPQIGNDLLRFGVVKLVLDGSIQGYTARMNWPGYLPDPSGQRAENGLWLIPPEALADCLGIFHEAGLLVHCHTNGDEALDVFLDAVEEVQLRHPRADHRHTAQHAQMATPAQFRRMAELGVCTNLFVNHLWFWGDQHRSLTVGEDRAAAMNACRSALDAGVQLSFHCDAPITPLGPLHTMWCAVNRVTPSGHVLGETERISALEALKAVTLGAAFQLRLDHEIGSIEPGKRADFTILDADPLDVAPVAIRDIKVWGTMVSGKIRQSSSSSATGTDSATDAIAARTT